MVVCLTQGGVRQENVLKAITNYSLILNEPVLCKKLTKIPCGTNYWRLAIRSWSYSSVPGNFIPSILWAFLFLTSATLDQCLMGSLSVGGSSHFVLQPGPSWPISVWPLRAHCRRPKEEHHAPIYCNGLGKCTKKVKNSCMQWFLKCKFYCNERQISNFSWTPSRAF